MQARILTTAQAQHVAQAMTVLANIGATCIVDIPAPNTARNFSKECISVNAVDGDVVIRVGMCGDTEHYANQAAFVAAYNLN